MSERRFAAVDPVRIRGRSVGDEVAARLERLIVTGGLEAGDRLPSERELAAELNVSRASLREAMQALESKNLIERRQGRGTTVLPRPDHVVALYAGLSGQEREAREAVELREIVEPRLAHLAALRSTEADLIALDEVLAEAEGVTGPEESLRLDLQFHLLVAQASGNALMASLMTLTSAWTRPTRELSHATARARSVSHAGHCRVLEGIRAREPEQASDAMALHLAEVGALTRERLDRRRRP